MFIEEVHTLFIAPYFNTVFHAGKYSPKLILGELIVLRGGKIYLFIYFK